MEEQTMYKASIIMDKYKWFKNVEFYLLNSGMPNKYKPDELDDVLVRYKHYDEERDGFDASNLDLLFTQEEIKELLDYVEGSEEASLKIERVKLPLDIRCKDEASNYCSTSIFSYDPSGYPISNIRLGANKLSFEVYAWRDLRIYDDKPEHHLEESK